VTDDDHYLHLTIHHAPPRARAAIADLLDGLHGLHPVDDLDATPAGRDIPGSFSGYRADASGLSTDLERFASVAFTIRTEEDRGEPGQLIIRSTVGTFEGDCDRSGTVLVRADDVARLAAVADPRDRAALLDELTGARIRAALPSETS
jgi:hypothetical protein